MTDWLPTAETVEDLLAQGWDPALIPDEQLSAPVPADGDYGADLVLWDDLTADSAVYAADDPLLVAQDCYHRLQTQRGLLPDDPDWGIDLADWLMAGLPAGGERTVERVIENELRKDARITTLAVTCTASNRSFSVAILAETGAGPFRLTLATSDADLLLEEIARG